MQHQPLCLYLKFEGEEWRVHPDLEPGVYPLGPKSIMWFVNEKLKVKAKRTGFQIVPNFSATAYIMQGMSLWSVAADCFEAGHVSKQRDMISAYIILSRVKQMAGLMITQARGVRYQRIQTCMN